MGAAEIAYVVQPRPSVLCDAIFRALPLIHPAESVVIGLPDTVWFPDDGLCALGEDRLSFLLFPVERPALFDAVGPDGRGRILEIQVKVANPKSSWVWGGVKLQGRITHEL